MHLPTFLATCRTSSAAAYDQLRELLARLEDPSTRGAARRFLAEIVEALEGRDPAAAMEELHFAFHRVVTGGGSRASGRGGRGGESLLLLQLPSVFAPEEWSRTFWEGLARVPAGEMEDRTVAELGCGNGWISLALARRFAPARVYGFDINPRAVVCARLNLYLNGLAADGSPVLDGDGRSLLDRVEFHVSDLLAWVREREIELDRVIGCIPQVLQADLRTAEGEISETASDELLHSLSNYTGRQGYDEDRFGLGLIARAVEESIERMRPNGRVVFNLGGRPGRATLRHLFRRRGFEVREVWTTKIRQAADTDILPLVEIEEATGHRFEFFLSPHSDEPVSARTALAYARAGGEIHHSLTVFEGRLRFPEPLQHIFGALRGDGWESVRAALDLSYEDDPVAEEKTAFLAHLADLLRERACFPYEATAGSGRFRRHLAEYLERYFGVPASPESFLVAPSRGSLLRNLLVLYEPELALVGAGFVPDSHPGGVTILECPRRVDLACRLMEALRPQLVGTTLDELEVRTPDSFLRLVETAGRIGARLIVDISPHFELGSAPRVDGVLQSLAEAPLPEHVAILCGLVKNRVYGDLEVCFLYSESAPLLEALTNAAEVTWSRTPILSQDYYDTILRDLLSFRLDPHGSAGGPEPRRPRNAESAALAPLASRSRDAFRHPAFAAEHLALAPGTIRLDYGENALPSPTLVDRSLFEAFARQSVAPEEADPTAEVAAFLRRRCGLHAGSRWFYGLGVAPLFTALAESCAAEGGTLVFPAGSYGYFVATADFVGARHLRAETRREDGFRLTPDGLDRQLAEVARPWLFLNGPVINPTGSLYTGDDVAALLAVAARHRARVILDVIFSGLEFAEMPVPWGVPWDLEPVLAEHPLDLAVLGGISKELAAGGLRFGFAACRGEWMAEALARGLTAKPHATLLDAARRIYAGLNHPDPKTRAELAEQRRTLRERAERLGQILSETGWDPLPPKGGLFLVARPPAGLDAETAADALFQSTGILINGSVWTGIPGHCRFVTAVEEKDFEAALERLRGWRPA
jgi:methionine S-methyltransferase